MSFEDIRGSRVIMQIHLYNNKKTGGFERFLMFQDRVAPPFPPAPRTPATTSEFQPPYFPPPFAAHGMLQVLVLVPHDLCCIMDASGADSSGGGFLVEHAAAELGRPLPSVLDSTSIPNTASESVFQSNILVRLLSPFLVSAFCGVIPNQMNFNYCKHDPLPS